MYKTKVLTSVAIEPITLAEAKRQLRVEDAFTFDDDYINSLISAARNRIESFCNRFFSEQQVALIYNEPLPSSLIELPLPDVAAVDAITYVDAENNESTVDSGAYVFSSDYQNITSVSGFAVESVGHTITLTTGAPAEFSGAKQAMLMVLTDMYELRTESVVGQSIALNPAVQALAYPYRVELGV